MADKLELAKIYVKAQADGTDDSIALLAPHLEDDALLTMALGPVPGKQAILTQMKNPVTMYNFTVINWDEPMADGDAVRMHGLAPIEATLGGFNLTFTYGETFISQLNFGVSIQPHRLTQRSDRQSVRVLQAHDFALR